MANPATVTFKCACGQGMKAKAEFAGRRTACPKCKQPVAIPKPTGSTPKMAAHRSANGVGTNPGPRPQHAPPVQPSGGPGLFNDAPASMGMPPQGAATGPAGFPGQDPAAGHAPPGTMPPPVVGPQGNIPPVVGNFPHSPPPQAANSMAADTCPSCGSFFPRAQPNCAKCRYSRSMGKKVPYQSMAQPVARMQAPAPRPKTKSTGGGVTAGQVMYVGGGTLITIVGFGIGALMLIGLANSETGRVRLRAFFLPVAIIASGFGMIGKGLTGE